jgi:3-hydroxyisobutyrate dehydrogenase-like beta-hydroxyacid dehydrogenase
VVQSAKICVMTSPLTIGIYSPGAMGSALGRAWQQTGQRVVTTVAGRSERTRSLADGLDLAAGLGDVVGLADVVVSIGPPARAVEMAAEIASACRDRDRHPVVADLNAIAPQTVDRVAETLRSASCELLDGSISGPPPGPATATRLYLSGPSAHLLADLVAPGLTARIVGTTAGKASAVKMCTASMYKGFTGLMLQALQTAHANGVTDIVLADLNDEFGDLLAGAARRIAVAASKANRFPGEMREIAVAQESAGGQATLFEAMAQVFESLGRTELGARSPETAAAVRDLDEVLTQL